MTIGLYITYVSAYPSIVTALVRLSHESDFGLWTFLIGFSSKYRQHLLPLSCCGHLRFDTFPSPLHHYVVPVLPTVLISLEIGRAHILVVFIMLQTLLRSIALLDTWVNVLVSHFSCIFIHLDLDVLCSISSR